MPAPFLSRPQRIIALIAIAIGAVTLPPVAGLLPTAAVQAQETTSDLPALLADSIFINADQTLTAEGAVEVLYKGCLLYTSDAADDREV